MYLIPYHITHETLTIYGVIHVYVLQSITCDNYSVMVEKKCLCILCVDFSCMLLILKFSLMIKYNIVMRILRNTHKTLYIQYVAQYDVFSDLLNQYLICCKH